MIINIYLLSIIFSVIFLVIVVELVRKNKLSDKYSLLWILFGLTILLLSISPVFIEKISALINIKYAPSVLFVFGLLFLIVYSLQITIVLSNQSKKIIRLTQEITLIKEKLEVEGKVRDSQSNLVSSNDQADNEAV
ncbi:DUF2304 domain-containing protein [Pseudobacteroides cellulosolvens]|uniref:DUF2304 domain-containing protein n=1 Tax=Pseudobacteroides cellulosolvens ATCC 35603 = DSM 2933 TaxID=398512 RepID=A0A0L6JPS2_9FIRM|nr:DUF2304 domain-containing protein [Pseudobacteroides cellulosolvens]KNY27377.1 Protein of unknown function DUF2304 [Pseudobacteroides cellulosolvens ATCC 35603 = DSM 2933]